jgi:hypothetical protein
MTRRRVFYDDWQFECCGEPFAIGDEVTWDVEEAAWLADLGPDVLHEHHHADMNETSPLAGTVARIQMVRAPEQTFAGARLRDVTETPDQFDGEVRRGVLWRDRGMLVDLDV